MIRTAILVDGAFYRKRAYHLYGDKSPAERADELEWYCKRHIREEHNEKCSLYRIFITIVLQWIKSVPSISQATDRLWKDTRL